MNFESLDNDLLLDLFQYFNISQLLHTFQLLNSRFNQLILIHLRNIHYLDFRSISKNNFNFICQYYLQSIQNQIYSLKFSNDDETPQQIQLFFSYGFNFHQFTYLKSLSFYKIYSSIIIQNIIINIFHLSYLTHLNFIKCNLSLLFNDDSHLINNLSKLSKLIHLQLYDISNEKLNFISSELISTSIKYLSIKNIRMNIDDLYHLLKYKPYLRHVQVNMHLDDEDINVIEHFPSITTFELYDKRCYSPNISYPNNIPRLVCLLRSMSNLYNLTIETPFLFLDGYRWKCLIKNFLPKLKIFQLKMSIYFNNFNKIKQRIDYIFDSFQNYFWLNEHQWFIRCHWNSENKYNQCILFYTLPYTFSYLSMTNNHLWSKSTCPYDNNNHWSSSYVHHLLYKSHLIQNNISLKNFETSSKLNINQTTTTTTSSSSKMNKIFRFNLRKTRSFSLSDYNSTIIPSSFDKPVKITSFTPSLFKIFPILYFPNIYKLTVELPFDEYFWSIIPKFDRLISLNIKLSIQNLNQSHLQILLDRTPCLYTLNINLDSISNFNLSIFNTNSLSIRRINLKKNISFNQCFFFNHEQSIALCYSSLCKQCEILSIGIKYRKSILTFINTMIHLRALNIRCQDDQYKNKILSIEFDDLIYWLKSYLPSTIIIERDTYDIRLWIR